MLPPTIISYSSLSMLNRCARFLQLDAIGIDIERLQTLPSAKQDAIIEGGAR